MIIANLKTKILYLYLILFIFFTQPLFANENIPRIETSDYDAIYENLVEPDFDYIFGLDPYQADEYTKYIYSPYPLFRSGVNLIFKTKFIPKGYYLLTPREKNGQTYVLFKENGKIKYVIPVYKEDVVLETFYDDKLPKEVLNAYQKASKKSMNFIGRTWGHKNRRTPIPQAYIEFNDRGNYWDMILYYGMKKYYLLFKKED